MNEFMEVLNLFPIRTKNVLIRCGIDSLDKLENVDAHFLVMQRGFSLKSLDVFMDICRRNKLKVKFLKIPSKKLKMLIDLKLKLHGIQAQISQVESWPNNRHY
jgi:hypothetical protein